MSKTLYRKYRPAKFNDVIGQDYIIKTLEGAIKQNRIGHAYLFTGPRGTGKTTVARIFAVSVNTEKRKDFEPVAKEVSQRLLNGRSMDIIEIDAASNTGVDDIRELKETVGITPTEAKYKVYIIDEVHMLSTNAFNALLKTLEEPPAHAIFILATTEIHKVPETILSRCQRFDFTRFSVDDIVSKLKKISKSEKVKISEEALEMIAITADGGMRDAESLLAQVFALEDKNITEKEVSQILGTTTSADILNIIEAFVQSDINQALTVINSIVQGGFNINSFIRSIIEKQRLLLFLTISTQHKDVQKLISIPKTEIDALQKLASQTTSEKIIAMINECVDALQKTKSTTIPQLPIEVASVNICRTPTKNKNNQNPNNKKNTNSEKQSKSKTEEPSKKSNTISADKENSWKKCITQIDKENKSLAALLTQCDIKSINTRSIILTTSLSFYKDKITEDQNRIIIETALCDVFGDNMNIDIEIQKKEKSHKSSELLSYATQIMGHTVNT